MWQSNLAAISISGGVNNRIHDGGCSFIAGGRGNLIEGTFSSILGGCNNFIGAGYDHVGMFGQNLVAVASNTFHVECLNAVNTPNTSSVPPGTYYWEDISTIVSGCKVLLMK